jgi:hypothetical protein
MRILLPVSLLLLATCMVRAGSERVRVGTWGGLHIGLEVTADGGTLELDCAHGTLDQVPSLDDKGRFDVKGTYVQEHGGPIRKDEDQSGRPARYRGTVAGDSMTLEIVPEGGPSFEPLTLTFGAKPKIMKCR